MASLSDSMYSQHALQMIGDLKKPLQMPTMTTHSDMNLCPTPEGMEQSSVWSSWRTGGSDRTPANYPCALNGKVCPSNKDQECGKSLVLRENSVWGQVTGSADGTGYVTTNWLPPSVPFVQIGFCVISRRVIVDFVDPSKQETYPKGSVSQLFLDNKPLLHYWTGRPFLFKTEQTPFIYMIPNAIQVKTGGATYRVDVVSAAETADSCGDCMGF